MSEQSFISVRDVMTPKPLVIDGLATVALNSDRPRGVAGRVDPGALPGWRGHVVAEPGRHQATIWRGSVDLGLPGGSGLRARLRCTTFYHY